MKLNLETNITAVIKGYKAFSKTQHQEIKDILEPFTVPSYANRFTEDGLRLFIKEQMDGILSNWKKCDEVMNQKVKDMVAEAKTSVLKPFGIDDKPKRPADYSLQIANAREFLKIELSDDAVYMGIIDQRTASEIDTELHSILKDFIDDYDTMKQFKKMVEKKVHTFSNYDGNTIFPKTFGKFYKVDSIMNIIEELEAASEMIFIHKRTDSDEVIRIKGNVYAMPMDGYAQSVDEDSIINNAVILDALADAIDSEGQTHVEDNPPASDE